MNSLIVASGASQQGVTMSSTDLLVYVNDARKWLGEPVVANRHFLSRIEDELEGELPPRKSFTHPNNGASVSYYDLTEDQCKLVAMRESKAVRRRVLAKLKELESRQHVTLPDMTTDEGKLILIQQLAAKSLSLIEENKSVTAERDSAIATKALIGSKREATAMAKASAAVRKVRKLEAELGFNTEHATVIAVERATGRKFPRNTYVSLRRWCRLNDTQPANVADPRYGFVKAWPAGAWLEHEGVDLKQLFPGEALA